MAIDIALDWALAEQDRAERKVLALAARERGRFLHATSAGRYDSTDADWWTSGFWPGLLWLAYQRSRDERLAALAIAAEDDLARAIGDERFDGLHHDVGFQFLPTAVMRHLLTGDPAARRRGLLAASLLMGRFNPASGVIEAWNGPEHRGKAIIDSLMNLPLLYWASEESGDRRYRNVADVHARAVLRHFVRADGSVHHIIRFDQDSGARAEELGGQGYAPESAWSRGQAWALAGFAVAHRWTGEADYLAAARRIADAFLAALPPAGVPPWDFRAPDAATAPRDSSAGAIAAAGLLELAHLLAGPESEGYERAARDLLLALSRGCATWDEPAEDALLRHATGHLPGGREIDVSLIYGDYYYLAALGKLNANLVNIW